MQGWAQMRQEHEQHALQQGHSILRDWIKGQATAVECGILSFEATFMPHMLASDGCPAPSRNRSAAQADRRKGG